MDIEKDTRDPLGLSQEDLETLFESTLNQSLDAGDLKDKKKHQNTPFSGANSKAFKRPLKSEVENYEGDRVKSSLRMKYEAEVSSLKKTHGDLEGIRRKLGLPKRKMAQLLLVDPSAWTRWTKKGGQAPPHIYRALEWYLLLQEKHPEYKSALWLNAVSTPSISAHEIESIKREVIEEARSRLDFAPTFIESESVDLSPLERRLRSSQKQVSQLETKIRWLLLSQVGLLAILILVMIF